MRQGTSSNRRSRNRNGGGNRGRGGNNRMQVFDSNGPDVRIRGTAHQICEKYEALAKDARSAGDMVLAESYLQHAEHYQRIISTWNEQNNQVSSSDTDKVVADGNAKGNNQGNNSNAEDLSLPASILGDKAKVESKADQKTLEDA